MPVNASKCQFAKTSVNLLGNNISIDGIHPLKDLISALTNYPRPQTIKELSSFLGAGNFCRQYVPKIAIILSPFNDLLKNLKPK